MPRTERFPHYVTTRKEHKCNRCGEIIKKGEYARYRNEFTGKRAYYHTNFNECDKYLKLKLNNK